MRSYINTVLAIALLGIGLVGARYITANYGVSGRWVLILPVALFYIGWWIHRRRQR